MKKTSQVTFKQSQRGTVIEVILGLLFATYMWIAGATWWMVAGLAFAQGSIILHQRRKYKDQ